MNTRFLTRIQERLGSPRFGPSKLQGGEWQSATEQATTRFAAETIPTTTMKVPWPLGFEEFLRPC